MDLRESIGNQTDVALSLSKQILLTESNNSNLVFSPLSIEVLLSLIASGSKGSTLEQLLSFLKSKSSDHLSSFSSLAVVLADGSASGGPRLKFANGVWVDSSLSLKPSFKQVVGSTYKAATNQVDFQTKLLMFQVDANSLNLFQRSLE
ncbi:serpin-ZX-like [Populus nigra]|uniref:serpin-ZX-like n=1 Tax=Populus nigra TaxID=3691 RepID=UPI002B267640|nr:serpin-ZX-like [Populus nigra]